MTYLYKYDTIVDGGFNDEQDVHIFKAYPESGNPGRSAGHQAAGRPQIPTRGVARRTPSQSVGADHDERRSGQTPDLTGR